MTDTSRLVINFMAQNIRTIINILLSLYSTRLVIEMLGKSDYGIYMLVAGVVSLLSFLTNSLTITTQRHLSYNLGKEDQTKVHFFFVNSYLLHLIIGFILALISFSLTSLIFDYHFLNIEDIKITEAKYVYYFVIISVFLSIITSPFRALLIARENIVYISIIDVIDGILKLSLVFLLPLLNNYRLPIYALIISCVMLFHFFALTIYCNKKYEESCFIPSLHFWNRDILRQIINFATWTLFGTACIFFRTQGVSVILNRFWGAIINAAYGIATQVFGSIQFLSEALLNAIKPQIIKAEGAGNREKMILLSELACKYCFLVLSLVGIPLIWEMPFILEYWLHDVPEHSVLFCRILLIASLSDQLTIGLSLANSAIGKIRNYTVLTFTIKALTVPGIWLGLTFGFTLNQVMILYVVFELIAALIRIPFLSHTIGISICSYIKNVAIKIIAPLLLSIFVSDFICRNTHFNTRFLLTMTASILVGVVAVWCFSLSNEERLFAKSSTQKVIKRFHR